MPKILNIITNPNPLLRKKSIAVKQKELKSKKIEGLCLNMVETMLKNEGVGLAAPQIGKNIRIVVINTTEGPICLINPTITKKSWAKEWGEEGCLSLPNVFGQVKRHKKIAYKYFNKTGREVTEKAEGLKARIIQHEVDHLNGVLFIDKARGVEHKSQ